MDRFVEGMRNLDASKFTTTNRIGATKTETVFVNSYTQEQREVPKTEVTMDDLFSGSNIYADQLKNQFQEWKKLHKESRKRVAADFKLTYFYDYDNHLFELYTGTLSDRVKGYRDSLKKNKANKTGVESAY
ncbi:hypothetical protein MFLO_13930 [Listeria floridensis FSL S10-1187]|uniref:Lipoprotein n=1 Tax=Listeria floridensis FSL S10-1187 TaxID=1265817 RepID=A0ABP3AXI9_9LIST|nr:hypothetical protein [Listeria floridensis]EUJ26761.1 hypothetical protein MFLO_13930 [Listeria floridensis FSL S10-1187]